MGKNNGKRSTAFYSEKQREKEFDEMKGRIMKDNANVKRERSNYGENRRTGFESTGRNSFDKPFVKKVPQVHYSMITDFKNMVAEAVNEKLNDESFPAEIKINTNTHKETMGIIFSKLDFISKATAKKTTIFVYYTENRAFIKDPTEKIKINGAQIMIINQDTGNVLFSNFGTSCVEKSAKYLADIINRTAELISKK